MAARRLAVWLLVLAGAGGALLGVHAVSYSIAFPDPGARAAALTASGHGYFDHALLFAGVLLALGVIAAALHFSRALRGDAAASVPAWVAVVLPVAYAVQEHVERVASTGHSAATPPFSKPFLVGLALQLPLGVVLVAALRLLLRALERAAEAILRARATAAPARAPTVLSTASDAPQATVLRFGSSGRAPPAAPPVHA